MQSTSKLADPASQRARTESRCNVVAGTSGSPLPAAWHLPSACPLPFHWHLQGTAPEAARPGAAPPPPLSGQLSIAIAVKLQLSYDS